MPGYRYTKITLYNDVFKRSIKVNKDDFISITDVARNLGVTTTTVKRWAREDKFITVHKFNDVYRVQLGEFIEWKKSHAVKMKGNDGNITGAAVEAIGRIFLGD